MHCTLHTPHYMLHSILNTLHSTPIQLWCKVLAHGLFVQSSSMVSCNELTARMAAKSRIHALKTFLRYVVKSALYCVYAAHHYWTLCVFGGSASNNTLMLHIPNLHLKTTFINLLFLVGCNFAFELNKLVHSLKQRVSFKYASLTTMMNLEIYCPVIFDLFLVRHLKPTQYWTFLRPICLVKKKKKNHRLCHGLLYKHRFN